jgi:hypothetical protein
MEEPDSRSSRTKSSQPAAGGGKRTTLRHAPSFAPRFTIGIFYLVAFFFLFSFLQVMPELLQVLGDIPPGPAQQRVAERVVRESYSPLTALVLSVATTSLGAYYEVLPGMRTPRR